MLMLPTAAAADVVAPAAVDRILAKEELAFVWVLQDDDDEDAGVAEEGDDVDELEEEAGKNNLFSKAMLFFGWSFF